MIKHKWVAYGLDMDGIEVIETEGVDINDSHRKAVEHFNNKGIDWDCAMSYESYMKEPK